MVDSDDWCTIYPDDQSAFTITPGIGTQGGICAPSNDDITDSYEFVMPTIVAPTCSDASDSGLWSYWLEPI